MPREKVVKEGARKLLEGKGYTVLREEFNVGVRPDLVAYKWLDDYEVEAVAVECKGDRASVKSIIDVAVTQAREYMIAFPFVYLATPPIPKGESVNDLKKTLETLRVGLIFVDDDGKPSMVREAKGISPRLVEREYIVKVRQRLMAISAYGESLKVSAFSKNVSKPEEVHCYMKEEAPNYLLANHWVDYYFGLCLEKAENVRKSLERVDARELYKLIRSLSDDYILEFAYIDTYKPREVSWPLMRKQAEKFTEKDAEWLLRCARRKKWKVRLMVMRKVWDNDELLSRKEAAERLSEVKKELDTLYNYLRVV